MTIIHTIHLAKYLTKNNHANPSNNETTNPPKIIYFDANKSLKIYSNA